MDIPYQKSSSYYVNYYGVDDYGDIEFDSYAYVNPASYDYYTDLNFTLTEGDIDDEDLQDFANGDLWFSMAMWEDMIKPAGLTMASFGFTSY